MAQVVNTHEAKTQLSKLLAKVEAGEEITIAKAGKPVAKLVPITTQKTMEGGWAGSGLWMSPDFDEMTEEELDEFGA